MDRADGYVSLERVDADDGHAMTRAERRDHTTQRILDAARHCFVESGFQGASMQQICAEVGMSPGALYRYFPSKESIIQAITENDRREDAALFSRLFENPDVIEGVVEAAMGHIRHVNDRAIGPLFAQIRAEATRNPAIHATCMEHRGDIATRFSAYIEAAKRRGEIDPVAGMDSVMAMFMAIGEGFAINDLLGLGLPEAEIEALVRGLVSGMLRPTGRSTPPADR